MSHSEFPADDGDPASSRSAFAAMYRDLHRIAIGMFQGERRGHTLQPTALVHEAFLRLPNPPSLEDTEHSRIVALGARAMRQALVDYARGRRAEKRGGGRGAVTVDLELAERRRELDVIELEDALQGLASLHPRRAQVAEMKIFSSLDEEGIAEVIGMSVRTVQDDWAVARAWLTKVLR